MCVGIKNTPFNDIFFIIRDSYYFWRKNILIGYRVLFIFYKIIDNKKKGVNFMAKELSKQEKIDLLHKLYGWDKASLEKNNDSQIDTLFTACKDEDGELRFPK